MSKRLATLVLALGCAQASGAMALGLGELSLQSYLNEPLNARVDLLNTEGLSDDQVRIRLATADDFDRLGIDRAYFLTSIKFEVEITGNTGYIVVTSADPVLEPYLDFIIEARWPDGRLLREYTVLIDPPTFSSVTERVSAREEMDLPAVEAAPSVESPDDPSREALASGTRATVGSDGGQSFDPSQREYTRGASVDAISGSEYLIQRNDTLWSIASRARPDGVSVHQTMLEIQRLNPQAFIDGNINRIKAGYIIYLPRGQDIGAEDVAGVMDEVRRQNADWQAQGGPGSVVGGPSLRISTEAPEAGSVGIDSAAMEMATTNSVADRSAALSRENAALTEQMASLEEQLSTLQSIVSLKDEQIAALQAALAEQNGAEEGAESVGDLLALAGMDDADVLEAEEGLADGQAPDVAEVSEAGKTQAGQMQAGDSAAESATNLPEPAAAQEQAAAPAPKPAPAPAPAALAEEDGLFGTLAYGLGAVAVIGLGALLFMRRKRQRAAEEAEAAAYERETLELAGLDAQEPVTELAGSTESSDEAAELSAPVAGEEAEPTQLQPPAGQRAYTEQKEDLYAADADTGDALAEADIYIAYGRVPQAVELLKNASEADPRNTAYRLKLLELCADNGDKETAQQQFADLREIGDAAALERARSIIEAAPGGANWLMTLPAASLALSQASSPSGDQAMASSAAGLPNEEVMELQLSDEVELPDLELDDITMAPVDLTADSGEELQQDFADLTIEGGTQEEAVVEDDLDLSDDFLGATADEDDSEEEFVFATEGDESATKLDLARAYLDMGDEEGARQILEEVAADGQGEPQQEAQALLQRLG